MCATQLTSHPTTALFGSDLSARCDYERRVLPSIITRCIEEVELRGMDAEGIYRKSGSFSQVKNVQQGFEDNSAGFDISDPDLDIHSVTSALKQYLRKLPTPLISFESYDEMLEAVQIEEEGERVEGLAKAVTGLPARHRDTLEFLIFHLVRVMEKESKNYVSLPSLIVSSPKIDWLTCILQMGSTNLAVVFAPTIMRPESLEREMADMELQRKVIQALLTHNRPIFGGGASDEE